MIVKLTLCQTERGQDTDGDQILHSHRVENQNILQPEAKTDGNDDTNKKMATPIRIRIKKQYQDPLRDEADLLRGRYKWVPYIANAVKLARHIAHSGCGMNYVVHPSLMPLELNIM